jgi:YgiT-type zinc finger domain-containing protein
MTCVLCKNGVSRPGTVTVTLERGKTVVVVRDVPADVCENCGEYYLDSSVAQEVYQRAEGAVARNAEVEILRYAGIGVCLPNGRN